MSTRPNATLIDVPSPASQHRFRRACATIVAALLVPYVTGCYTYKRAAATSLPQGTEVSLTINDQGRVGLGDRLGASVLRVNGRVVDVPDSTWIVRVSSVDMIAGGTSHWSGEEVRLPRSYVGDVSTREFSRARTWLVVGITIGAVAAVVAGTSLIASGYEGDDGTPPRDGGTMRSPVPAASGRP